MKTNDIISKFQSNNTKLETVLSKKMFSGDVKNLLLNMLYKITNSYNDYVSVKVNVENKNKFIDNIIEMIEKCESIEIIKPNTDKIHCKVDTFQKTIEVFPTERDMLFALFKMNDTKMFLDEKYNLIRIALPELLNEGRDINNIEIIRDFNAWSWNTLPSEISNIDCNLIYQNLQILLGFDFLDNWMKLEKQKEVIGKLEKELKSKYNSKNIDKLLNLLYRISIIVCTNRNEKEKERLTDEKKWEEKELERLSNKEALVTELTETKKEQAKVIEQKDRIINDKTLLAEEYDKRNKDLPEYKKIFNMSELLSNLKRERRKAVEEIDKCNYLLDANNYVKEKTKLEKDVDLLQEVQNDKNKEKYKIQFQKIFIKCLEESIDKIEKIEQKREAMQLLRIIRYYNFIPYDDERFIKDVEVLQDEIEELEDKLIEKLYNFKGINPITKDFETDLRIIKSVFTTRIMQIENIVLQVENKDKTIEVNIYDGDIIETGFEIENSKDVKFKNKKKIKLFIK